ncbi:MAG: conjugal transfer protein TraF [Ignavibacteriaceae bacterium]|nr:conjugal transfer protein TraF [Ignavibacteriaceae bacterium]
MKYKIIYIFLMFTFLKTPAQELSNFAGAFVDIGFGARPAALGNAYVGLANDVNCIVWNPAGISSIKTMQTAFTYTKLLGLVDYNYLAFSLPLKDDQGAGAALIVSGDAALREYTLNLGYSRKFLLDSLYIGFGLKFRYASFGNNSLSAGDYILFESDEISDGILNQVKGSAFGFGFDFGVLYHLNDKIKIGLMFRDIYSPLFWNSKVDNPDKKAKGKYSELIPFEPTIGTSFKVSDQITFTTDYTSVVRKDVSDKLRAGIEASLFQILSVRGGVQYFLNNEKDEKYSLGLGLNFGAGNERKIHLDYTFMMEEFANSQRISIGLEF